MCWKTTLAKGGPVPTTVAYLSQHQRDMDGRLVRVRARVLVGWEGDNFLVDPTESVVQKGRSTNESEMLWISCEPGYFHFVLNEKLR
jgi:hypothetical protein